MFFLGCVIGAMSTVVVMQFLKEYQITKKGDQNA